MTLEEFLIFLIMPVGGLAIGYFAMRLSRRETERFDRQKMHPGE